MTPNELAKLVSEVGTPAAYGQLMGREDWGKGMNQNMPSYMHHVMLEWIAYGRTYDEFLAAVVNSDLMGAAKCADQMNRDYLFQYCNFLHNYAPSECFGSKEKAQAWATAGGLMGHIPHDQEPLHKAATDDA
jgi:hypothetical protein